MAKKRGKTKSSRSKRKSSTKRRDPLSQSNLTKNAKKHGGVGVLL